MSNQSLPDVVMALSRGYRLNIRQAINAKALGLNGMHAQCLRIIAATPDCTANHIVSIMHRDKGQIARLVKELITMSLIEKHPNPADKRSQILTFTDDGHALMNKIHLAEKQLDKQMCEGLSTQDIDAFKRISARMVENLHRDDG